MSLAVVERASGTDAGFRWGDLRVSGIVLGLVFTAVWLAPVRAEWESAIQTVCGVLGCALIVARFRQLEVPRSELGIRIDNLLPSMAVFALATSVLCVPAILASGSGSTAPFPADELPAYFAWASLQQFVAVGGFWLPFRLASSPSALGGVGELRPALAAACVFAIAHAPNLGLMALVGFAETLWLFLFARFRNLVSLSLAHAAAALVVSYHLVPSAWLSSMTVGLAYWR